MIDVLVNGEPRSIARGTTLARLLEELGVAAERVAVERNGALVRRAEHAALALCAGDVLEIVTLVGGG